MSDVGSELVELLDQLTGSGRAIWCQSSADCGYVYCFVGEERVEFQVYGASGSDLVSPSGEVHGALAVCRNQNVLYVQPEIMCERLMELLRAAPTDDGLFRTLQQRAFKSRSAGICASMPTLSRRK